MVFWLKRLFVFFFSVLVGWLFASCIPFGAVLCLLIHILTYKKKQIVRFDAFCEP